MVVAVSGLVIGPVHGASAEPTPAGGVVSTPTPETVCSVTDARQFAGLTGLVATDTGYVVVSRDDGTGAVEPKILTLDTACKVTKTVKYPFNPLSPEDLAIDSGGTLWVGDVGDKDFATADKRATVALWKLAPGTTSPVIHRVSYPGGTAHDASAILMAPDGNPIIVTKEASGPAELYQPTGPLKPDIAKPGVPLKKVGTFAPKPAGNPAFAAGLGQTLITGGAISADGKKVALRTYSAVYEWDVAQPDVAGIVQAIAGQPRVTALATETRGEALAYSRDGRFFLTLSLSDQGELKILKYSNAPAPAAAPAAVPAATSTAGSGGWLGLKSYSQTVYLIGGVGVVGLVLVLIGVMGIRRSRRNRRAAARSASGRGGVGRVSVGPVTSNRASAASGWAEEPADHRGWQPAAGGYDGQYQSGGHGGYAQGGEYDDDPDAHYYGSGGGYQQQQQQQQGYPQRTDHDEPDYPGYGNYGQSPGHPRR